MSAGCDLFEILPVGSVNDYSHSALKLARSHIITKSYSEFKYVIISRHILELNRARCYGYLARDVTTTIYGHFARIAFNAIIEMLHPRAQR